MKENEKVSEVQSSPVKDILNFELIRPKVDLTGSQWFRCAIGLHRRYVIDKLAVTDSHNCEVGLSIISRCECCGKIFNKFIITKDIR